MFKEELIKEELTPLKEAIFSMEAKLEAHDASLEKVNSGLEDLEAASSSLSMEEVKSALADDVEVMEGVVLNAVEEKITKSHENKMTEVNKTNEANSKHLIDQLFAYAKTKGGNYSSDNKTFSDPDMSGTDNTYNSEKTFRQPHVFYVSNLTSTFITEHPFSTS